MIDDLVEKAGKLCAHTTCGEMCDAVALVREAHKRGVAVGEKAFGGCHNCYGKGYSTVLQFAEGGGSRTKLEVMRYCWCARGIQLSAQVRAKVV